MLAALVAAALLAAPRWVALEPGLERSSFALDGVELAALRIDPARFRLEVVLASELGRPALTAREFVTRSGAVAALNGGFFDPSGKPIGLRVHDGKRVAGELRSRLGALAVLDGGMVIVLGSDLASLAGVREVVQCGPRLVVAGLPNRLKPQIARRSVVGLDRRGRVVLAATKTGMVEASVLAGFLARAESAGGLALREALNLDGGGSTQFHLAGAGAAGAAGADLDVLGATPVPDAILVLRGARAKPASTAPAGSGIVGR